MIRIFFLFVVLHQSWGLIVQPVDVSKIDYCKLPCITNDGKRYENSGCKCVPKSKKVFEYILEDYIEFRTGMLEIHNYIRNVIAGGFQKDPTYPSSSNMRALSYNIENEYLARCWAVRYTRAHDECRRTSTEERSGQNVVENKYYRANPYRQVWSFYDEIYDYDPTKLGSFGSHTGKGFTQHFTQMVWAKDFQVGCAMAWGVNAIRGNQDHVLVCNYAGGHGGNTLGARIYQEGPPCSQCPRNTTCNSKFKYLCGEIDPIPTNLPPPIPLSNKSFYTGCADKKFNASYAVFVLLCLYFVIYIFF